MSRNLYKIRLLPRAVGPDERVGTVARAYALAAAVDPRLTPGQWASFVRRCRRQARHRGGMGVLEDRRGYVHAVFRYAVGASPLFHAGGARRGRTMWLQDVIIARLPGGGAVGPIVAAGELLARAFGCVAVALELPAQGAGQLTGAQYAPLTHRGYAVTGGPTLVRTLDE